MWGFLVTQILDNSNPINPKNTEITMKAIEDFKVNNSLICSAVSPLFALRTIDNHKPIVQSYNPRIAFVRSTFIRIYSLETKKATSI